jgi:hypothetical protein
MKISLPLKLAALLLLAGAGQAFAVTFADDVPSPSDAVIEENATSDATAAGDDSMVDCCCGPSWCFEVGAVILHRSSPDNTVLLTDPANASAKVCGTGEFDLGYEVGPSFALHHALDCCSTLELKYFFIDEWNDTLNVVDTGVDYEMPYAPGVDFRDMRATFETDLHSFEANVWHCHCNYELMYGLRYIDISEETTAIANGVGTFGAARIQTENRMLGLQGGARKQVHATCNCCVSLWGKGGVYWNNAEADCDSAGDYGDFGYKTDEDNVSWVTEAGVRADHCVYCNMKVFAAYEVLWLGVVGDGLAVSTNQYDKLYGPTSKMNEDGDAFYHGAVVGVEWCH